MALAYFQPTELDEALNLLSDGNATVVAGCTDYFPARGREPAGSNLLDLTRVRGLRGLEWTGIDTLRIGAATPWSEIVRADLPPAFKTLQVAAAQVGGIQIQNAGTIGGNICNASPAADGIPPLLILEAMVEIAGPDRIRTMPIADFVTGVRKTALSPDEIVSAFVVRRPPAHSQSAFQKLGARKYLVISICMTAAMIGLDEMGRIDVARVSVGACSTVARRLHALEADLLGKVPKDVRISAQHLEPLSPISDVRADAGYRQEAALAQILDTIHEAAVHG